MSGHGGFSPRVMFALGGLAVALFALALLFTGGGEDIANADGPNSYSRSAIGHRALYEMLAAMGRKVLRADANPLGKLGDDGVLVLIEPNSAAFDFTLPVKIAAAKRVLLVLPKTIGISDPDHPGWIRDALTMPPGQAEASLAFVDPTASLGRDRDLTPLSIVKFPIAPLIERERQRVVGGNSSVVIGDPGRYLLGVSAKGRHRVVVLADPDPIENLGVGRGDNAAFALALFDWVGGRDAKFVFDETVHGFSSKTTLSRMSPLRRLLNFPGNLVAALALIAVALLIAATVGRFGPPLPAPRQRAFGKQALIDSIASLMDFGGRHAFALRRYVEGEIHEAALLLRAPPASNLSANLAWLDKAGADRGVAGTPSEMLRNARAAGPKDLKTLFAVAAQAHRWKEEMVHGSR
jgi:hypothetical protein